MADKILKLAFENLAQHGKLAAGNLKKWFKMAGIISEETGITESDVDAAVEKCSKDKENVEFTEVQEVIITLEEEKKVDKEVMMEKLATAGSKKAVEDVAGKFPI